MSNEPPAIAVFDLDGTVTRRDTCAAYLLHVLRRRPHRLGHCLALPFSLAAFGCGHLDNAALKRHCLAAVAGGARRREIEHWSAEFVARCFSAGWIKPAARRRLDWHRHAGHRLILASAGLDLYVPALAARLGFEQTLCTLTEWRGDVLTGALDGPNLRGEAKLAALRTALDREPSRRPAVFAYSDHHSDLPLLRFADHGVAIDPTPALAAAAGEFGFRVENWDGRRRTLSPAPGEATPGAPLLHGRD